MAGCWPSFVGAGIGGASPTPDKQWCFPGSERSDAGLFLEDCEIWKEHQPAGLASRFGRGWWSLPHLLFTLQICGEGGQSWSSVLTTVQNSETRWGRLLQAIQHIARKSVTQPLHSAGRQRTGRTRSVAPAPPRNPRRDTALKQTFRREERAQSVVNHPDAAAVRYGERTTVERVDARLKDDYGGRHVRVRGPAKVIAHLAFGLLPLTVE